MRLRFIFGVGIALAAAGAATGCTEQVIEPTLSPQFGEVTCDPNKEPCEPPPCDPNKGDCEEPATGRMTGGGGQIIIGDVFVSRGFTIHCDILLSNNLEINWPGNMWHLDKPLTSAECVDDPLVDPEPPPAPFDTFIGEGTGRLNGVDGSVVKFTFVDAGEPGGRNDRAQIQVFAPDGTLVLNVPMSFLDRGNLQAHFDQPHGSNR